MKTALVTGGTKGIGASVAAMLVERGYRVAVVYQNDESAAVDFALRFPQVTQIKADLSSWQECARVAKDALAQLGKIDLLVNNAGRELYGLFQDIAPQAAQSLYAADLFSAVELSRALLPSMLSRGEGGIVNVASVWGDIGGACEVDYSAAKAGLIGFTKALSKEVARSGVRVNAVCPAATQTAMLSRFDEEERKGIAEDSPLGRILTPQEVAQAIVFLAEASGVTGAILPVGY